MLSLVDYYYIRLASPPPKAIKGVKGIHLSNAIIPSKRDILIY
jgi:xanthosine utilization system XapX-like protein